MKKATIPSKSPGDAALLADRIMAALLAKDACGATVQELAAELRVRAPNLHVWFSTTGKKRPEILKVGEARYAYSEAYRPAPERKKPAPAPKAAKLARPAKPAHKAPAAAVDQNPAAGETIVHLAVDLIDPDPAQHRSVFPEASLDQLGADMRDRAQDQPIIVRPAAKGRYQLIAGERRWRAAQRVGLADLKAIVRKVDHLGAMRIQAAENLQREGLNPLDEARAYGNLAAAGELPAAIMATYGLSKSAYYDKLRLFALIPAAQQELAAGRLSESTANLLARLEAAVQTSALRVLQDPKYAEATYRVQKELVAGVVESAKAEADWREATAKWSALGARILTIEECRSFYISDAYVNDYANVVETEESGDLCCLRATCHEDPRQRTFAEIIGEPIIEAHAARLIVGRANSDHDGPVLMMLEPDLRACLSEAGFDPEAENRDRLARIDAGEEGLLTRPEQIARESEQREREWEIEAHVAEECRRDLLGKIKCTGMLVWKLFFWNEVQMCDVSDILGPIARAIGAEETELEERIEDLEELEAFEIIWKEMQVLSHDGIAKCAADLMMGSGGGHFGRNQERNEASARLLGLDYSAIRARVAGPEETAKRAA